MIMKHARRDLDPLAQIDDLLSSLCADQSRPAGPCHDSPNETRGKGDLNLVAGKDYNQTIFADDIPTTPEKSTTSKDTGPTKPPNNQHTQSHISKRFSHKGRITKTRNRASKQRQRQRGSAPSGKKYFPCDNDLEQREDEGHNTSSDERENNAFLHQMKRLAAQQLNVRERKQKALNAKAINNMRRHWNQCAHKLKQIAGNVSSNITNRSEEIKAVIPNKLHSEITNAMSSANVTKDGVSDLISQAKSFKQEVNMAVEQLCEQRKENKEKHDAREGAVFANVKEVCVSGKQLMMVLQKVDEILSVGSIKEGQQ